MNFPQRIEAAAMGRITCQCGNSNWRQFLYCGTESGPDLSAGCKKCGAIYSLSEEGTWQLKGLPADMK